MSGNKERVKAGLPHCGFCDASAPSWYFSTNSFIMYVLISEGKFGIRCSYIGWKVPRERSKWKCLHCEREVDGWENALINDVWYEWRENTERRDTERRNKYRRY